MGEYAEAHGGVLRRAVPQPEHVVCLTASTPTATTTQRGAAALKFQQLLGPFPLISL